MRPLAALALASLVVLAGCSAPFDVGGLADDETTAQLSPAGNASAPSSSDGATTAKTAGPAKTAASAGTAGSETGTAGPARATATPERTIADPPRDVIGWEGGYWYNESIPVSGRDGLDASEQGILVNRTMARIEVIRQLEFNHTVPVEVISRTELQNRPQATGGGERSPAFRAFDNAKFEALFLIGEDQNSLGVQQSNRGQNVLGYYSPVEKSIVIVSPTESPQLNRSTLAHELVHALQDQRFGLGSSQAPTREAYNARNGLIEGEANYVQRRYDARCGDQWRCLDVPTDSAGAPRGSGDFHLGVYAMEYFPYADGPGFVESVYDRAGWRGVNALHESPPESTEQIIHPRKYGRDPPQEVSIDETNTNGWERVEPGDRPSYAVFGQSALSAMFAYTLYDDYSRSSVVGPTEFLNTDGPGRVNRTDPFNYGLNYTDGWDGDRMYVYQKQNETGYVWKLVWDSPEEAREFADGYRKLLTHWGGERVLGQQGVWEVEQGSPFADSFSVRREGDTVTIVNAPATDDLNDVYADA